MQHIEITQELCSAIEAILCEYIEVADSRLDLAEHLRSYGLERQAASLEASATAIITPARAALTGLRLAKQAGGRLQ